MNDAHSLYINWIIVILNNVIAYKIMNAYDFYHKSSVCSKKWKKKLARDLCCNFKENSFYFVLS